jgi:AraC-like DNA-binding protein
VKQVREPTISVRVIVPFIEVAPRDPNQLNRLGKRGICAADLANPELRVPCRVAHDLLTRTVKRSGDQALGVKAGEMFEPGLLDVATLAARSCATLRDSIVCALRFVDLTDQSLRVQLIEESEHAILRCWRTEDPNLPALNDFTLISTCALIRESTRRRVDPLEVHFKHHQATDAVTYARIFEGAVIKLGMPYNALVFRRSALDEVLAHAHPGLQNAYEVRAKTLLSRLNTTETVTERVHQIIDAQLRVGEASMPGVARELSVSVATLRRHLQREGQGFSDILEEVRRTLAEEHLSNSNMSIMEIAHALGFSHVAAFYRAFRRWFHGVTPTELRARRRAGDTSAALTSSAPASEAKTRTA